MYDDNKYNDENLMTNAQSCGLLKLIGVPMPNESSRKFVSHLVRRIKQVVFDADESEVTEMQVVDNILKSLWEKIPASQKQNNPAAALNQAMIKHYDYKYDGALKDVFESRKPKANLPLTAYKPKENTPRGDVGVKDNQRMLEMEQEISELRKDVAFLSELFWSKIEKEV